MFWYKLQGYCYDIIKLIKSTENKWGVSSVKKKEKDILSLRFKTMRRNAAECIVYFER